MISNMTKKEVPEWRKRSHEERMKIMEAGLKLVLKEDIKLLKELAKH